MKIIHCEMFLDIPNSNDTRIKWIGGLIRIMKILKPIIYEENMDTSYMTPAYHPPLVQIGSDTEWRVLLAIEFPSFKSLGGEFVKEHTTEQCIFCSDSS